MATTLNIDSAKTLFHVLKEGPKDTNPRNEMDVSLFRNSSTRTENIRCNQEYAAQVIADLSKQNKSVWIKEDVKEEEFTTHVENTRIEVIRCEGCTFKGPHRWNEFYLIMDTSRYCVTRISVWEKDSMLEIEFHATEMAFLGEKDTRLLLQMKK